MPGVVATAVGYSGGAAANPTYRQVCEGGTGHCEVVLIEFDSKKVAYEELLATFFRNHNPAGACQPGSQYRSAVFTYSEDQRKKALEAIRKLRADGIDARTEVSKSGTFWMAEAYHQQYYGG